MGFFETDFLTFLDPVELKLLKLTCKLYNQIIKSTVFDQCIIKQIKNKINQCHLQQLIDILKPMDCFISGSFVIQSILNENYDSDIDIYVLYNEDDMNLLDDYLEEFEIGKYSDYDFTEDHSDFFKVVDYNINDNRIQLIYIKYDFKKFINHFDFDICKNYYDIKNNSFYSHAINQVLYKKFEFKVGQWVFENTCIRAEKYQNRGFKMNISYTLEELIQVHLPKTKVDIYHVKLIEENDNYRYCELYGDVEKLESIAYYLQPYLNHNKNIGVLRKLRDKHLNHISLHKVSRNTDIDMYVEFYYKQSYEILWDAQQYYVFLF